ncbi:MAG: hypothetical protein U0359_16930 [Byssovorax sp.]
MGELRPYPFAALLRRMLRELSERRAAFDLPSSKFAVGDGRHAIATTIHGIPVSTPLGPAAGPHTQLAQNIVLSWLAGGRVIELKTVQDKDDLVIARPCIDMRTVGFNVEWSQELKIHESLEEYVKARMALRVLVESGLLPIEPGFADTMFEASIGYDLAGITGSKVQGFLRGLADATAIVERLRAEIPEEHRRYRDLDFDRKIAEGVTLSTFHGCPPAEIEKIAAHVLREHRLACVIKLNPTLLGKAALLGLLHDQLGYRSITVPDAAFEQDLGWDRALAMLDRLSALARSLGLGFGVKLTNTLVVENTGGFLPASEPLSYLSGPPLHVLAMELVGRFRREVGHRYPISFSAGIDARNFPYAVALDLRPVTVCTDWLKAGGYGRGHRYFEELYRRMDEVSARTREDFVIRAFGQGGAALDALGLDAEARARCVAALENKADLREAAGDAAHARWVAEAALCNTAIYARAAAKDARYAASAHEKSPKKVGRTLALFDCLSCDKCIPACPNDAIFRLDLPLGEDHQIGIYADVCNACGNCDVICPEDGGPHRSKPRFFGTLEGYAAATGDAFWAGREGEREIVRARIDGEELCLDASAGLLSFTSPRAELAFREDELERAVGERGLGPRDRDRVRWMNGLRRALFHTRSVNFVNSIT